MSSFLILTSRVLDTMLRVEVSYPKQKVIDLIGEYEEYLESTGKMDIKQFTRTFTPQAPKDGASGTKKPIELTSKGLIKEFGKDAIRKMGPLEKDESKEDEKSKENETVKSNEDDDDKSEIDAEGDEDIKPDFRAPPDDVKYIPKNTNNLGYYNVLKGMITQLELDGTLGTRGDYGRTVKGGKINEGKDEEYYYNLDDEFIDDNELVNNESMHKDFSQVEVQNLDDFYDTFEFLPCNTIEKFSEIIKARKRQRIEDEQIDDPKINEKCNQLEKAVKENKDGKFLAP